MIITLLAGGTRGDTQPYIALGIELQKAGHHVRLASHENYAEFVNRFGLEFYPIRGDVSKVTASAEGKGALNADNPLKVLLSFNQLKSLVFELQQDFYDACGGSDAVVYHPGTTIGYFAAQQLGIPAIFAPPFPMTPTRAFPALIFYDKVRLGGTVNWLTHKLFEQIMWSVSSAPVKQFLQKKFGQAPKDFGCPFGKQSTRRFPTIISCSQAVFPRPADWSEYVHIPGYWFLDEEPGWQPTPDLVDFLHRGEPPVYVGFGSMGDPSLAAQTTELVTHALQQSRQRGILATGWTGMTRLDRVPENMFFLDSAPHAWLFPQMTAVVHHGGAGTTAAGFRSGVPSVIIPSSNDQFAWGRRACELEVGAKPIPRNKLTADNLSHAIDFVLMEKIRDNAQVLGKKIQSENGAAAATQIILSTMK